jgi:hypothetical protein
MAAIDVLTALGFKELKDGIAYFQAISDESGMSKPGEPHTVLSVMQLGDVTAYFEQNVSPDNAGGVETLTKHPPILVLESPRGRVCIGNYDDAIAEHAIKVDVAALSARD